MDGRTIGILGGGQLGRMMIEAGHRLGVRIAVLDPGGATSPAGQLADIVIEGSFVDEEKIRELGTFYHHHHHDHHIIITNTIISIDM